jgi:hypothetical protein
MWQKQDKNKAVLVLAAMSGMSKNFEEPVIMLRHANDWLIYTSQKTSKMAKNKLRKATKEIEEWTRRCGFKISSEKT